MSEGTSTSHGRPDAGNLYPWLLEASGGTYHVRGRARFPEGAKPPSQFIGGRLLWELVDGDLWRFDGEAYGNAPGDSTVAAINAVGECGEAEIVLINRGIMDALWAADCRAARVDSYAWEAAQDGAYLLSGDLVVPTEGATADAPDDDAPACVVAKGHLADTVACLAAVFGRALEVGKWARNEGGLFTAPVVRWAPEVAR